MIWVFFHFNCAIQSNKVTEDVPVLKLRYTATPLRCHVTGKQRQFFPLWYVKRDRTRKHRCFINTRSYFTVCSDHLTKPESFLNSSIISWLPQHLFTPLQRLQWFSPFSVMMFEKTGTLCWNTLLCSEALADLQLWVGNTCAG